LGLERGPLSVMRKTEELLEWKNSGSGSRKSRLTTVWIRWPCDSLYPQKLALTSPTSGGRLVCIICLQTKATEFMYFLVVLVLWKSLEFQRTAWPYVPEDRSIHNHRCENIKF
jgi:hypothetical protein